MEDCQYHLRYVHPKIFDICPPKTDRKSKYVEPAVVVIVITFSSTQITKSKRQLSPTCPVHGKVSEMNQTNHAKLLKRGK